MFKLLDVGCVKVRLNTRKENGNRKTESIIDDTTSKLLINDRIDQNMDGIIHRLNSKIQAQDKYIEGMEELHGNAKKSIIHQRDKLKKEVIILKKEASRIQNEAKDLMKENIELRNELRKLKESKEAITISPLSLNQIIIVKNLGFQKWRVIKKC